MHRLSNVLKAGNTAVTLSFSPLSNTHCVTRAGSGSSSGSGSASTSSLGASVTELFWLTNAPRFGSFRLVRDGVPKEVEEVEEVVRMALQNRK